jgi:hypothetical protein
MGNFVSFSKNTLISDANAFFDEYDFVHPEADAIRVTDLNLIFSRILSEGGILRDSYKEFMRNTGYDDSYFDTRKIYWLFYDLNFASLVDQLRSFMIEKNDLTLNPQDYTLLFYISLQNAEVQNSTQNLSLPMLHDMFLPIAEEKLNKWKLS